MNLGFMTLLGTILEPAMRPLFNLPGSGGFILGVSYLSGFPLCAILTARLRKAGLCTKDEGERLISFTSNASPLFMLGAVSVGMYQNPAMGPFIALIHYLSNFLCGVFLKLICRVPSGWSQKPVRPKSLKYMLEISQKESRLQEQGFGCILGETIRNACLTLLAIGGFITLFSVLLGILQATGFFPLLLYILSPLAKLVNIDTSLLQSLLYGIFEMTIGISEASKSLGSITQQLMVIEAILAWNGLAIQAQIAGMMIGSDLSILPYLYTRFLQVPLAVFLTYLCSFLPLQEILAVPTLYRPISVWHTIAWSCIIPLAIMLFLILFCFGNRFLQFCRKKIVIFIR